METKLYNSQGKESGNIALPEVFDTKVKKSLLYEVVVGLQANKRAGTASTKSRGEVSGGGAKPWKQKGTGNARAGSNRSGLWRKGGIIFGPKPRDYYQRLSQAKRHAALSMALSEKANNGNLIALDSLELNEPKTKAMSAILKSLNVAGANVLIVVDKAPLNLKKAARNIQDVVVAEAKHINAYEVLWANKLVITSAAIDLLK